MYKIAEYADRIASEESEIREKYEIIKSLSQDFTVPNDIALKLDKEVIGQFEREGEKHSETEPAETETTETDVPEIELRYIHSSSRKFKGKINTSEVAANFFREIMDTSQVLLYEQFIVLYVNRANEVIGYYRHSKGGISGTVVDIRLILLAAIKCLASGIVLCHNHPTGNLKPSDQDNLITSKLKSAAKLMEINLLDHIIVTAVAYYSFADQGLMGTDESGLSGIYSTHEDEKFNYVDEGKLKKFVKLATRLKF